jgi:alpha/beta superfamily hydrolase
MYFNAPRVIVDLGRGVRLDAQVHTKHATDNVGVLIVHPYPLLGGSMRDPVVIEVFRLVLVWDERPSGCAAGAA